MNHHVCDYYLNIVKGIDKGCPMMDYCAKDVYLVLALRNM